MLENCIFIGKKEKGKPTSIDNDTHYNITDYNYTNIRICHGMFEWIFLNKKYGKVFPLKVKLNFV